MSSSTPSRVMNTSRLVIETLHCRAVFQGVDFNRIKPFNNPNGIKVVVVGGKSQSTWFATDFRLGRGIRIDAWR